MIEPWTTEMARWEREHEVLDLDVGPAPVCPNHDCGGTDCGDVQCVRCGTDDVMRGWEQLNVVLDWDRLSVVLDLMEDLPDDECP